VRTGGWWRREGWCSERRVCESRGWKTGTLRNVFGRPPGESEKQRQNSHFFVPPRRHDLMAAPSPLRSALAVVTAAAFRPGIATAATTTPAARALFTSAPASAVAAAAALHSGSVPVPDGVTVAVDGDTLTLTGPLGTSTTSLSRLDGRGDGALRVAADGRAIEVASVSKPFYGTLTSLLRSKMEVRDGGGRETRIARECPWQGARAPSRATGETGKKKAARSRSYLAFHHFSITGRHPGLPGLPPHYGHRLPCLPGGPDPDPETGPLPRLHLHAAAVPARGPSGADPGRHLRHRQEPGHTGGRQPCGPAAAVRVQGEGGEAGRDGGPVEAGQAEVRKGATV